MNTLMLRMMVRETGDPRPTFVRWLITLPIAPFPGLQMKELPDHRGTPNPTVYVVQEVRFLTMQLKLECFVARHGDAHPLQPSLTQADAIVLGWEPDPA